MEFNRSFNVLDRSFLLSLPIVLVLNLAADLRGAKNDDGVVAGDLAITE